MTIGLSPHGAADERSVAEVESRLGVSFPPGYRDWLLTVGGGLLDEDVVIPGTDDNGLINQFEPVGKLVGYQELAAHKLIPAGYVAIALGDGGSVAIRTAEDDYGSVWWASLDKADELEMAGASLGEPTQEIMARLSDDFPALLTLLGIEAGPGD